MENACFNVEYTLQDGGEENRQFIKSEFQGNALQKSYEGLNLVDPTRTVLHCQHFSHVINK